ncbi:hypothetical protein MHYP_G00222320 [Metynnis hypsauchen]
MPLAIQEREQPAAYPSGEVWVLPRHGGKQAKSRTEAGPRKETRFCLAGKRFLTALSLSLLPKVKKTGGEKASGIFKGEKGKERERERLGLTELGELDPVADGVEMENGGLAVLRMYADNFQPILARLVFRWCGYREGARGIFIH